MNESRIGRLMLRTMTMLFAAFMMAGCSDIHSDKDSLMLSTWCTPDGHANWVWASGMQNAIAVPRLDKDGKPVLCTAVAAEGAAPGAWTESEVPGTQSSKEVVPGSQPRTSGGKREEVDHVFKTKDGKVLHMIGPPTGREEIVHYDAPVPAHVESVRRVPEPGRPESVGHRTPQPGQPHFIPSVGKLCGTDDEQWCYERSKR